MPGPAPDPPAHGAPAHERPAHDARDPISDSGALLEMSTIVNASLDLDFILSNILLSAMGKLLVTRGVILVERTNGSYRVASTKGVRGYDIGEEFPLHVNWTGFVEVETLVHDPDPEVQAFLTCCAACGISVLVPLRVEDRMVGVLGLGTRITGAAFDEPAVTFLHSIAAIAATAVKNAVVVEALRAVNRKLDTKIQEMHTLFELSREMSATFDEENILRLLGYALMGQIRTLRYVVFVHDGAGMAPALVKLPDFAMEPGHAGAMATVLEAIRFTDERQPATPLERWLAGIGMSIIIPMRTQRETRGLICLGMRLGGARYEAAEIEYLTALASITINALENARLFKETIEKQRLERELDLARTIQKGLLPAVIPQPAGYEIAAVNESSQQVGGDYYDVIQLSPTRFALAIGDVSGKGIPASLLMANVQAALRIVAPLELPIDEATERMNALVHANTAIDRFITFFWGILDTEAHTFHYVNAGHNPPYLVHKDRTLRPLGEGGLILGVLAAPPPYEDETVSIAPGETIVAYTDGVNEAMSAQMREFGDERLQMLLANLAGASAEEIVSRVRSDILDFTCGAPQSDDITMLVVRRL